MILDEGPGGYPPAAISGGLTLEYLQQLVQFGAHLTHDLVALGDVLLGTVAGELLAGTADGEALLVQEAADLADHQDVVALVIAAVAAAFHGFELGELLLPVAQHVRLHAAQVADLADGEVALPRDRGQFAVVPGFQHRSPPAP